MTKRILPIAAAAIFAVAAGAIVAPAQTGPSQRGDEPIVEAQATPAHMPEERMERGGHGPRHAYDHHGPRRGKHGPRGERRPRGENDMGIVGARGLPARFSEIDEDGDGAITQTEVDTYVASQRTANDADGDGAISVDEFEAIWLERTQPMMADAFQRLDEDASGEITEAELAKRYGGMVERMDRDDDGALKLQRRGEAPDAPASESDADAAPAPADE